MGTSTSYGGPMDRPSLLPSWAVPSDDNGQDGQSDAPDLADQPDSDKETPEPQPTPQEPPSTLWQSAKTLMTNYATGGARSALSRAGTKYVSAKGGATRAASLSTSGRAATAGIGGFLSSISREGIAAGLEFIGLSTMIGEDVESVLAAILNVIAPAAATVEEAAARYAVNEVLEDLYERHLAEAEDLSALENMTAEDVEMAIVESVAGYIYHRWLEELGLRIERGAVSEADAIQLEHSMKEYIQERLQNLLEGKGPLAIDWNGEEGSRITNEIYLEAYSILEAGE